MGNRGENTTAYALYEELGSHLRVDDEVEPPYIYKRSDSHLKQSLENRPWQIRVPIPEERIGIRKSLRTSDKDVALRKAEKIIFDIRVQLAQGGSALPYSVEKLVAGFLEEKKGLIRGEWEGKVDKGNKSITKERYNLIEGKLRNYLIPFLGKKADVRGIPEKKWSQWRTWRMEQHSSKAITLLNEQVMIREVWQWGIEMGHIPFSPRKPFHNENYIPDDKMRRDTWEAYQWSSFARMLREWLNSTSTDNEDYVWDAFLAYQMVFFIANCGMRIGELVKVKNKDIDFFTYKSPHIKKKVWGALIDVHKSTKTGERQVNAGGGEYARRVWNRGKHKKKEDFLFCHLDGSPFTTKQFRSWFQKMTAFTNEDERWGKRFVPYSLRHFYATTRLQNGTNTQTLCKNMGVGETYLQKHYSHYMVRLDTDELVKINKDLGIGKKVLSGDDFIIPEAEETKSVASPLGKEIIFVADDEEEMVSTDR